MFVTFLLVLILYVGYAFAVPFRWFTTANTINFAFHRRTFLSSPTPVTKTAAEAAATTFLFHYNSIPNLLL